MILSALVPPNTDTPIPTVHGTGVNVELLVAITAVFWGTIAGEFEIL